MAKAARMTDPTSHAAPLGPGPGSPDVRIGQQNAWRALPAGSLGAAVESASQTVGDLLAEPTLNPGSAGSMVSDIVSGLVDVGAESAAAAPDNPNAAAVGTSAASATTALLAANVALTATWTAASAAPGGQPAADVAYTKGIQSAAAAAASATFSALGGMADLHNCPMPTPAGPHGPGVVTRGSATVRINGLPAARQDDSVVEACGGSDAISAGAPDVNIGG